MDAASYLLVVSLLALVLVGVEVAVALGLISMLALYISTGDVEVTLNFLGSTGYEVLRDYIFAVVPLFILMGVFIARSGAASDLFWAVDRWLHRLPGRLAHATVLGNVLFGFVTGTSVAAAITFTAIAYPQMKRYGYNSSFQLGLIAGSACLGMLIPPSLLLVIWAILTDQSIGQLFLAGIVPGVVLALGMLVYIAVISYVRPGWVGHGRAQATRVADETAADMNGLNRAPSVSSLFASALGFVSIVVFALGGIWLGFLTPTEGAGIGALIALILGLVKGMRWRDIQLAVLETGRASTPLLAIVFAAQLYARTLSMSGIGSTLESALLANPYGAVGNVLLMMAIWFVLGMLIDSISIMLLTVPIFGPVAAALGIDPILFALVGIVTIEAGLLTPPFGINVYAVRGVVNDPGVSMTTVFWGVTPYWAMLLMLVPLFFAFPGIVTFLPNAF